MTVISTTVPVSVPINTAKTRPDQYGQWFLPTITARTAAAATGWTLAYDPDSSLGPMIAATIVPLVGAEGDPERAIAIASMLALIVAAIGVLRPEKCFERFVDLVAELRDAGTPVHGVLMGEGPERATIEAHARARGLGPDDLTLAGAVAVEPA